MCILHFSQLANSQLSGGDFELLHGSVTSGGGSSSESEFSLSGSIARPEANTQKSSAAEFTLSGGFWRPNNDYIFNNGFEIN